MKTHSFAKRSLLRGAFICAMLGAAHATSTAATVISDTFTTGSSLVRQPDTINDLNLTWAYGQQGAGNGSAAQPSLNGGRLQTGFNSWHYLNISTSSTFTKATEISLSADLTVNTIAQNNAGAGVALGFWSTSTITSAQSNFYGLILEGEFPTNTARISIWVNGTRRDAYTISSFDKTASYNLAYTVDTTTGSISSVSLNGSAITLNWGVLTNAGIFTDTNTNYAGAWGRSNNNVAQFGYIDNFTIAGNFSVIPEPQTAALLFGFASLAGVCMKRRRK